MKIKLTEQQLKVLIKESTSNNDDYWYFSDMITNYRYGSELPKMELDEKMMWVVNQMVGIVDELIQYNISSDDYMNVNNLGFKKNGNIGYFDIGFGDYFEDFHNDVATQDIDEANVGIADDIIDKIIQRYEPQTVKRIGGGHFGMAFDIGNGRVLKFTKDKSEAVNCNKLIGKKCEHLSEIYSVKQYNNGDKPIFIIVLEKLTLNVPLIKNYFSQISKKLMNDNSVLLDRNIIQIIGKKHPLVAEFMDYMYTHGYEKTWEVFADRVRGETQYDFNDISEITEWIEGSKTYRHVFNQIPEYIEELVQSLIGGNITEQSDNDYRKWKRKNVTIRGMKDRYSENGGGARFGDGLYTAFLSNKKMAKEYGTVYFVLNAIPKHPKVVRDTNLAEIELQGVINNWCKERKERYNPDLFYKHTTMKDEMLRLGYDGLVIKGREMVNYTPPDDVKYFENERQLERYYDDFIQRLNESHQYINIEKEMVLVDTKKVSEIVSTYSGGKMPLDKERVLSIVKKIQSGNELPPIKINNENLLIDGHHRYMAYKIAKINKIPFLK